MCVDSMSVVARKRETLGTLYYHYSKLFEVAEVSVVKLSNLLF